MPAINSALGAVKTLFHFQHQDLGSGAPTQSPIPAPSLAASTPLPQVYPSQEFTTDSMLKKQGKVALPKIRLRPAKTPMTGESRELVRMAMTAPAASSKQRLAGLIDDKTMELIPEKIKELTTSKGEQLLKSIVSSIYSGSTYLASFLSLHNLRKEVGKSIKDEEFTALNVLVGAYQLSKLEEFKEEKCARTISIVGTSSFLAGGILAALNVAAGPCILITLGLMSLLLLVFSIYDFVSFRKAMSSYIKDTLEAMRRGEEIPQPSSEDISPVQSEASPLVAEPVVFSAQPTEAIDIEIMRRRLHDSSLLVTRIHFNQAAGGELAGWSVQEAAI